MFRSASSKHDAQIALMKFLSREAQRLGVAKHVYVVGGAVRNFVLDQPIKDIDVVIDSVALKGKDSEWFAQQIARVIPTVTNLTTNQYGVAILTVKGPWNLDGNDLTGEVIEIANARKESYGGGGKGYKPDEVVPATIEEDVERREFTFNTLLWRLQDLAQGPEKAEIIDLTGCGLRDLRSGTMACPRDPDVVFADDPTRMLRAIKFVAKYGFKIPPDLAASIQRNAAKMKNAPWEAIATLFVNNVLNEPTAPKALRLMKSLGLLDVVAEMVQEQKPFAAYLSRELRGRGVHLLLDLLDLGLSDPSPLKFLAPVQQARLREVTTGMPTAMADAFAAAVEKPPVDNGALIKDFSLQGPSRALPVQLAREALLEDPSLYGNDAALDRAIRSRLGKAVSRVASRYRVAKSLLPGGVGRRMKPSDFNQKELAMGIEVEKEHLVGARYSEADARMLAQEIAMDHLTEVPDYYTRLKAVEGETGPNTAKKAARLTQRVFYRGQAHDLPLRLNQDKVLWLALDPVPARTYGDPHWDRTDEGVLYTVTLKPSAKILDIADLSDPIVRELKEMISDIRQSTWGPISDENWGSFADFGLVEGYGFVRRFLRSKRVDGILVRDRNHTLDHASVALFGLGAVESIEKEFFHRSASVKRAAYFNVGDPILYGRFQNKPGTIARIWTDERGIPMIEIEPTPKGRKKNRVMGLFRIRHNRALIPPVTDAAIKVAARYKEKKKVKTKDGDEMTVYVYSDRQVANRNREKAERIDTLRDNHADLLDQIKKDLGSDDPKTRLTALAVGLIDNTYERVGNDESADDGHFGVTGWLKKHLTFSKGKVVIKYVGKSGVKHEKIVSDADLLRVLKDCCEDKAPDDPIFGFPDEEGGTKITSRDVNDYLAEYDITAKDLRGYHANREMQEQLRAVRKKGPELPRDRKEKDKILKAEFKKALEAVAEAVGHEPSTLRSQYLVPWMEDQYVHDGTVIDRLGKKASIAKRAEVTGDGSSVGLFIPLSHELASQYEVKAEDPSPPHVTLLFIGPVPPEREEELVEIVERFVANRPAPIAVLNGADAFYKDDGSSVVYSRVQFANDMKAIRDLIWDELDGEGFNVQHSFPSFHPHTTIEYRDEANPVFTGKLPTGSWVCDRIEIWGLPKKRAVKFAPVRVAKKASVGKHVLPPLPYAYDALEPHISEETLKFHHDKHHKAYVDGLNKAEKQIAAAREDEDYEAIPAFNAALEFNSGGHVLHTLYWPSLVPTGDYEEPSDDLVEAIEADFGSWDAFRSQMKESTIKVRGSGWGVLVLTPAGLRVVTVMNHENGVLWDGIALLPIDAWEHAYYLDYQNDREAHFDAVFDNLVNWPVVERRLNDARAVKRVARGKAKKDVGHGGLDEWFSGHGGAKGKGEEARWGDWVSISPVKKTLDSGKKVEPGDIVGPCGISDDPDWADTTNDGADPLKCMPREKAHDMPKKERAEKARAKMRTERSEGNRGKKPTYTPTFAKKADSENEPTNEALWEKAKERYGKWPSAYAVGHALKIYKDEGGGWRKKKKAAYGSLNEEAQATLDRGSRVWPLGEITPPLIPPPADDSETTANEVAELVRLSEQRPAYRKLVESLDAEFPSAFVQLCAQLGVPCDEHRIGELVEESKPVILALKAYYNRSRPFQVSPDIHPIASDTTQTPSYPSGHTAQAWLIARDLAALHPEHKAAFFDLARLVAKTRLLGGVHFRSDNDYAEILAAWLAGWVRPTTGSRVATKTEGERQDEEAERLVKPSPKKKPPRKDLKRRRVEDSDTTTDPDKEQDRKDRSQNYKDASRR